MYKRLAIFTLIMCLITVGANLAWNKFMKVQATFYKLQHQSANNNNGVSTASAIEQFSYSALSTELNDVMDIRDTDIVSGNPNAAVTVVEYSSLACPHCADFYTKIMPKISENYVITGKIKYIHRDLPTNKASLYASMLAYCSGDKRRQWIIALLKSQSSWAFNEKYEEILNNMAQLAGSDEADAIFKCIKNTDIKQKFMEQSYHDSKAYNITGTPIFFINGTRIEFVDSYEYIAKVLDEKLDMPRS